jgi:hypothetical protein
MTPAEPIKLPQFLQGIAEVQRQVGQARRQNPARGTARQVGQQAVALGHAAAVIVNQLAR